MKIAIGSDEVGFELKGILMAHLIEKGHEVVDCGTYNTTDPIFYADIAVDTCHKVTGGECERAVLVCGTGIGMAMTANRVPGIRAAVCHDPFSTERSIKSNNAQVCCMGARVIAPQLAMYLLDIWMSCAFAGGPSAKKIERMMYYDKALK